MTSTRPLRAHRLPVRRRPPSPSPSTTSRWRARPILASLSLATAIGLAVLSLGLLDIVLSQRRTIVADRALLVTLARAAPRRVAPQTGESRAYQPSAPSRVPSLRI